MKDNKNKGFSLVELLIALVVSGIILSALLILVTQGVNSYNKQTAVSQIMNEIDLTLNQIGQEIMEADGLHVIRKDADTFDLYTDNVVDKSGGDQSLYKRPCGYKLEDKILYYYDLDGEKNEVAKYVEAFKVYIDRDSFTEGEGGTISKIDGNVRLVLEMTMNKQGNSRTVKKVIRTRNDISDALYVDVMSTFTDADGSEKEVVTTTKVNKGDSINLFYQYLN